jgi:hypothetical protein
MISLSTLSAQRTEDHNCNNFRAAKLLTCVVLAVVYLLSWYTFGVQTRVTIMTASKHKNGLAKRLFLLMSSIHGLPLQIDRLMESGLPFEAHMCACDLIWCV